MKKQTAVEWLVEQIKSDQNQKALSPDEWMKVIEQAKQMEKEQTCTSNQVPFYETCYCNPKNGGSGICGCTMSHKMVDRNTTFTTTSTTTSNTD